MMITTLLIIVNASRSATAAFSWNSAARQYHTFYALRSVSGSVTATKQGRSDCSGSRTALQLLRYHNPAQYHNKNSWLSQHQQFTSSSDNENEEVASIDKNDTTNMMMGIPSIEQLRTDSFMKQVQYAEFITGLIQEDDGRETDVLMNRLRAQLSHPDGIRGFMVTFLTTTTTTNTDEQHQNDRIPPALIKAIMELIDPVNDTNELISLMCMNVIMPTGMITMQTTEELSQQSTSTADRAIQLLKSILDHCRGSSSSDMSECIRQAIESQCHAILSVAISDSDTTSSSNDDDDNDTQQRRRVLFWKQFFQKWGYQSQQEIDIANAIRLVLS